MKKNLYLLLVAALTFTLSACSGSKTEDAADNAFPEEELGASAGTDSVPQDEPASPESQPVAQEPAPGNLDDMGAPPAVAMSGDLMDYTVQKGDTLMKIAYDNYGDLYQWKKIYQGNQDKIRDPMNLTAGTVLKIEKPASPVSLDRNGTPYLIKKGDTLGLISKEVYGTQKKWKKLWENNRQLIREPNRIYAGFYLYYMMTPEDETEKQKFLSEGERIPASPEATPAAPTNGG